MPPSKARCIGILTSGGDCPGLNAAIRGVAKAANGFYGMEVLGILDGFTGLIENRVIHLGDRELSGLLTQGGTVLGTSRNKPHRMPMADGSKRDMTGAAVANYRRLHLDCLICIGGDGTAKNALVLKEAGLNVLMIPKTIDNDVAETDVTFGYDSAMYIATEAIDRLHTTASSHQRIMLVDLMGHNAGWLALGAGIAGGADVILIPEIPYSVECIAEAIRRRVRSGSNFSIVAVAEGARDPADAVAFAQAEARKRAALPPEEIQAAVAGLAAVEAAHAGNPLRLAAKLEELTGLESRVTILGYVQRGGTPSAADRLLATRLGSAGADLIRDGVFGVMVAARGDGTEPVPLELVAGKRKPVPPDHAWVLTARHVGTCLGD